MLPYLLLIGLDAPPPSPGVGNPFNRPRPPRGYELAEDRVTCPRCGCGMTEVLEYPKVQVWGGSGTSRCTNCGALVHTRAEVIDET